jgi:hypothetical protein
VAECNFVTLKNLAVAQEQQLAMAFEDDDSVRSAIWRGTSGNDGVEASRHCEGDRA